MDRPETNNPKCKKRIILCCDGSWDGEKVITRSPVDSESNVSKFARCISPHDLNSSPPIPQIVFYGSADHGKSYLHDVVSIIRQAYSFLVQHYVPGDEILLFGFSRGAFVVRTIAEIVVEIGILNMAGMEDFHQVLAAHKLSHSKKGTEDLEPKRSAHDFLNEYRLIDGQKQLRKVPQDTLECVGVWDTVGTSGIPEPFAEKLPLLGFKDRKLSVQIKYGFHAIALSETRKELVPSIWERQHTGPPQESDRAESDQVLKQVWFPCSHLEAGGQIEEYDDVTYISLIWMIANVIDHHLLSMNEEFIHILLSVFWTRVQRGFGLYDPEGGRRYCLTNTARQFPTGWKADTNETIHRSAFSSYDLIPGVEHDMDESNEKLIEKLLPFEVTIRNHLDFLMQEWAIHQGHRVGPDQKNSWPDQESWFKERWYHNFKQTELTGKPSTHSLFLDLLNQSVWPTNTQRMRQDMISSRRGKGHVAVEEAAMRILGSPMD
ncbi:hypothetical protein PSTG_04299 [Puccinia striiformis f. sp. tritici PST-78]|uniref:T6SS Phospholipase effector Tle1-like catalytic domain-containing protein n=1 Tax=Puccinia striiformis f. sp. tritici PST-78 TaxID=1165861 RepID=A0A0L0VSZ7_9BASI|nr:hypothetical protein PSTG_04299 [Puccinia striiformis f. sp. tritici PST-78]